MTRLEIGTAQSLNRQNSGKAQQILKAIQTDQYWSIQRYPTGKLAICIHGDSFNLPANWFNLPNMLLDDWNDWAKANNRELFIDTTVYKD